MWEWIKEIVNSDFEVLSLKKWVDRDIVIKIKKNGGEIVWGDRERFGDIFWLYWYWNSCKVY